MAERVLAAAEIEKTDAFDGPLGATVATIELGNLGLMPRLEALVENPDNSDDLRHGRWRSPASSSRTRATPSAARRATS